MLKGKFARGWGQERLVRRRTLAIAVSLCLHVGLLSLLFLSRPPAGGLVGGGGAAVSAAGTGSQGISLSLVRLSAPPASASPARPTADPLTQMMNETTNPQGALEPSGLAPMKARSVDALLAAADRQLLARSPASSPPGGGGQGAAAAASSASSSPHTGAGSSAQAGDLWPQVEPCWRRAIWTSEAPVTLEVVLGNDGKPMGAPQVLAPNRSSDVQAARVSLERALQAIAACTPYHAGSRLAPAGVYRISFGVSR